ncbi:MAG TPA: VWA domain-containing protein [Vicinamibacterales bacterium]|nr:VWA domain-containing protein [Vicinamibacterales bacterium]
MKYLWLAVVSALVQQPAAPPIYRAGVEVVRLDVQVTDAEGQPVRDLRQDEVQIVEAGAARPVVFFQHLEEPRESYAETARHTVAGEVSTNEGAARGHLYVIVFDELHITPGGEQRARIAVERFLTTRVRRGDRVALYALPGPGPQIAFTSDVRRLVAELPKIRGTADPNAMSAMGQMSVYEAYQILQRNEQIVQRVTDRNQGQAAANDTQRHTDASSFGSVQPGVANPYVEDAERIANVADGETRVMLSAMSDILRQMRTIEGRKSVLFVSEGFYGDRLRRDIENVAAAAAESYSVIEAFDVNRHELDASADAVVGADQANAIHEKIGPLGSLATETGGALVIDANRHADEAFDAVANQTQDYYLVGFTPAETTGGRDAYRPVTVRVTRRGVRVSTRTGFALTDSAAALPRHQAIERAMAAPFPQQALPLQYTTYVLRGSSTGMQRVIVSLAADLPLANRAETQPADVVFLVRAATDGRVAASGHDALPLPTAHGRDHTTGTATYHVQFEVPAGDYLMRVVVREPGGLVGSADRRFTVRALDGPALTSGDLILSGTRGDLPVRPTAYIGDGLSGVLELYGRTAEQVNGARVRVDLVPIGESDPVASGTCDLQPPRVAPNGTAAREARLDVPLQSVPAGTYVARARVLVGADTAAEVERDVEVRAGHRPDTPADDTAAFDPRAIANGSVARQFASALAAATSPAAADASRALERLGAADYPAAVAALDAVLAADPHNASAAFLLGWAYHGAGDDRLAISAWRRAAYEDPTLVSAHLALADVYVRLSQPALAIQAVKAGLAALPQSPELLDRLRRLEAR